MRVESKALGTTGDGGIGEGQNAATQHADAGIAVVPYRRTSNDCLRAHIHANADAAAGILDGGAIDVDEGTVSSTDPGVRDAVDGYVRDRDGSSVDGGDATAGPAPYRQILNRN